jgi:tetratricopeptide (TPR) repeat protein
MNTRVLAYRIGTLALILGLLALGGRLREAVTPQMDAPQMLTDADRERLEHVASASLFGELRGSFADYLWLKADRLVHNGVEMRALTTSELRDKDRWRSSQARGQETPVARHEEGETTVVPNRGADHRGILGDLERQIKPYMDMRNHRHRDPGETAALFRLMTWTNPHFVQAWVVGANVLAENLKRPKDAINFLKEGADKNPDSLEIQVEIGRFLLWRYHDGPSAERYFRRAILLGATRHHLPAEEEDAWENAYRWLFIQYHTLGRHREAQEVARTAMRRFPQTLYFRGALDRDEAEARRHS